MSGDRLTDAELAEWTAHAEALGRDDVGLAGIQAWRAFTYHASDVIPRLLREVRERRADDSKRAWVDAGAPMLGEPHDFVGQRGRADRDGPCIIAGCGRTAEEHVA